MDGQTDKPKALCPPNFKEIVGGGGGGGGKTYSNFVVRIRDEDPAFLLVIQYSYPSVWTDTPYLCCRQLL